MPEIRPIRNNDDLTVTLARIDALWGAEHNTPDGDEFDILCALVEHYETQFHPNRPMEPVELLLQHMEGAGKVPADLANLFGSQSDALEVLDRKRALTVDMIHKLSSVWRIPADCLVTPYHVGAPQ